MSDDIPLGMRLTLREKCAETEHKLHSGLSGNATFTPKPASVLEEVGAPHLPRPIQHTPASPFSQDLSLAAAPKFEPICAQLFLRGGARLPGPHSSLQRPSLAEFPWTVQPFNLPRPALGALANGEPPGSLGAAKRDGTHASAPGNSGHEGAPISATPRSGFAFSPIKKKNF